MTLFADVYLTNLKPNAEMESDTQHSTEMYRLVVKKILINASLPILLSIS